MGRGEGDTEGEADGEAIGEQRNARAETDRSKYTRTKMKSRSMQIHEEQEIVVVKCEYINCGKEINT